MTDDECVAHLRPLDQSLVESLCDRATRLASDSFGVRLEIDGFRRDRTPWDARRLANILTHYDSSEPVQALVRDLDAVATSKVTKP